MVKLVDKQMTLSVALTTGLDHQVCLELPSSFLTSMGYSALVVREGMLIARGKRAMI